MKESFELTLFDTELNVSKSTLLGPLEIMFDDPNNELPLSWYEFWNGNMPFGTKVRITLEVVE